MPLYGILMKAQEESALPDISDVKKYNFLVVDKDTAAGTVGAFTLSGVNYKTKQVVGYLYDFANRNWIAGTYSLPQVVFNRSYLPYITNNKLWRMLQGRIFNSHLWLSKLRTHIILEKSKTLKRHLPPVHVFNYKNLYTLLQHQPCVYIKPVLRAQGRGIIRVCHQQEIYSYSYMSDKELCVMNVQSFKALMTKLRSMLPREPHFIQKEIMLAQYNDYKYDFRLLTVKDGWSNHWHFEGSYCRMATIDKPVTNASQGANKVPTVQILYKTFGKEKALQLYDDMITLAQDISFVLGNSYPHMALLGLDFGIDINGSIWFFEANAYPGLAREVRTQRVASAIWEYAKAIYPR